MNGDRLLGMRLYMLYRMMVVYVVFCIEMVGNRMNFGLIRMKGGDIGK